MRAAQLGETNAVLRSVSKHFNVSLAAIYGHSRPHHVVVARQAAMYLLRNDVGLSYKAIGFTLHRDHSTVVYAVQKVRGEIADPNRRMELMKIRLLVASCLLVL